MKKELTKNTGTPDACKYTFIEESDALSGNVKTVIRQAFDDNRAFSFIPDPAVLSGFKNGIDALSIEPELIHIRSRILDDLSGEDLSLKHRLSADSRLNTRLLNALTTIHELLAVINDDVLCSRRFVLIKELPGVPTLFHIAGSATILTHVGQGPFWQEIPTIYTGLKVFDLIAGSDTAHKEKLIRALTSVLKIEERAIELGYTHAGMKDSAALRDVSYLLDEVIAYNARKDISAQFDLNEKPATFTAHHREHFLQLLDARDEGEILNFDHAQNNSGIDALIRLADLFKSNGERESLHETIRLLVSASGHDLHEIRNRANIALEKIFAPKPFDAPVAEVFHNIRIGETLELSFTLPIQDKYLLRIYENTGNHTTPVNSEISFEERELVYNEITGKFAAHVNFVTYGHRDFAVVRAKEKSHEWIGLSAANGRINVMPDLRGEVILEIFTDIHGHSGVFWRDERGHPGLVYNEHGEIIRLGRFSDIADHLAFLKERYFVSGIYLLGIFERGANRKDWAIGATSASPFSPMSLSRIEQSIGGAKELKALVEKAHSLDIKIIVDMIPHLNRLSGELPDENIVMCYDTEGNLLPRSSTDGRFSDWNDGKLLNFRRFEVWQYLANTIDGLIQEYDIDGVRFDTAHALPVMLKRNNFPFIYEKKRTNEEMLEGRIIVNDRAGSQFITTGYYDSQCRDTIPVPLHQFLMHSIERSVKRKKKNFFINIAECYWGHERFLSRCGIIPYNTTLFKVCENIIQGKSDVREIYHIYDNYYPATLCGGTELIGIFGNHDERRALNTFGVRGLRAATGLTSFLSSIIMDYEGSADGEGWRVALDNININWNQFEVASHRSLERFYSEIYSLHRKVRGRGYLVWSNNNMVAAAIKCTGTDIWLGAFNFADTSQTASIQFDNPVLPIPDNAYYRVVDPIYSSITGHYNFFSGSELKVSRINTVISFTDRMKLLRLELIEDIKPHYRDFIKDSFYRLCSISRDFNFKSNFVFQEFTKRTSHPDEMAQFINEHLIPLFWKDQRYYLELGLKRTIYHCYRNGFCDETKIKNCVDSLSSHADKRIAHIGKSLKAHNKSGPWVFLSAEADPFSKSGGLANVVYDLPRELAKSGEKVFVITPYYRSGDAKAMEKMKQAAGKYNVSYTGVTVRFMIMDTQYEVGVHYAEVDGVMYYLLDHHELFDGLYWGINAEEKLHRRVGFARASAELICAFNIAPHFAFSNDAFAGLFNGIVRCDQTYYTNHNFERTSFFHIIHNGGFQYFDMYHRYERGFDLFRLFNLPDWRVKDFLDVRREEDINCMAAGIRFADRVITVSPSYARQIQFQCDGLEKILHGVKGISNAIGSDLLDRMKTSFAKTRFRELTYPRLIDAIKKDDNLKRKIELRYPEILAGIDAVDSIADETRRAICSRMLNKLMLQTERKLQIDPDKMVCVMIHRITEQKGFQLLLNASETLFKTLGIQAIIGGAVSTGDEKGEEIAHGLWLLGQYYPKNLSVSIGFQEISVPLLSSDIFLMPSVHEPGGIAQIEAFICGCLVLARATGGLRDTVHPVFKNDESVDGNGFLFSDFTPSSFADAISRAQKFFEESSDEQINDARTNARKSVYFWDRPAAEYIETAYDQKEIVRIIG